MDAKVLFGFLFLVSVALHSQKNPSLKLFKSPKNPVLLHEEKNNFALNVPEAMLLDENGVFKNDFPINQKENTILVEKEKHPMPVFEPSLNHNMPISPIDSTNTYFLRVYPANPNN